MLHEKDFPTIPLLMKLYMSLDNILVIPYMLERVPNFKAFISLEWSAPIVWAHKGPKIMVVHA
jgi:hypothetical protein